LPRRQEIEGRKRLRYPYRVLAGIERLIKILYASGGCVKGRYTNFKGNKGD